MTAKLGSLSIGPRSPGRDGLNPHHQDYTASAEVLKTHLIRHAGLTPESRILEIGCGTGRLPKALKGYLTTGTYLGTDLNRSHIKHCQEALRFTKGFKFKHDNTYHQEWNPSGIKRPYQIPTTYGTYDIVLMIGVLYHYDFFDAAELIHTAAPLLRSYGALVATAKLLNHHSMSHLGPDQFPVRSHNGWFADARRPGIAVAHPEEGFRRIFIKSRLQIRDPIRYGFWAGAGGPLESDLIVSVRV